MTSDSGACYTDSQPTESGGCHPRVFPGRKVAFYRNGGPGKAMLGLWEIGRTTPPEMKAAPCIYPGITRPAGMTPRDFAGTATD